MASQQQLTEAEAALHKLLTGTKAVKLQQNGRSVEYQPTDVSQLRAYISELKNELSTTTRGRRTPIGFY